MAISSTTSRKALRDIRPERDSVPIWAHPEVLYWYDEWKLIRDAASGEKDVKEQRDLYLPSLDGMEDDEYDAYLDRATYYNFTGRTIQALVGTLFKKDPQVEALPTRLNDTFDVISQSGTDFISFAVNTATELFTLGRHGVLVDLPEEPSTTPQPYLTAYTAENILDWKWTTNRKTGRRTLTEVILREYHLGKNKDGVQQQFAAYRVLQLRGEVYSQRYYFKSDADADIDDDLQAQTITPTRQGAAIKFIPFLFFGVTKNEPVVEKSPMLDIARINISHFRSYAHLEHGRFFTGLPVYYAEGDGTDEDSEYIIGPSVVWNLPPNAKAGILEFNGHGLKFLENALLQKEAHAASLGGRMVGITAQSTAETDNQTELKNRNEQALLLNMSRVLDVGFTILLRWWAWMAGVSDAEVKKIEVEFTKDFLLSGAGSREFRAIHAMYKDGVIPVEVLHDYLAKNEVIPDWLDIEEFKALLESQDSFPNQPDFQARKEGFPNAQAKVTAESQQNALDAEAENLDTQIEADEKQAKLDAETAKDQAKVAMEAAKTKPKPATGAPAAKKPAQKAGA